VDRLLRRVEAIIAFSRWLIVPMLFGLVIGLGILVCEVAIYVWELIVTLPSAKESDVIVGVLTLATLALTGHLVLIMIFSSYENFVHRISSSARPEWPTWMVKVDFAAARQRLTGTVVVIGVLTAIEMYLTLETVKDVSKLGWIIAFLIAIVLANIALALADRLKSSKDF
jgi:uncharacterized protein (TIGR00645 family)